MSSLSKTETSLCTFGAASCSTLNHSITDFHRLPHTGSTSWCDYLQSPSAFIALAVIIFFFHPGPAPTTHPAAPLPSLLRALQKVLHGCGAAIRPSHLPSPATLRRKLGRASEHSRIVIRLGKWVNCGVDLEEYLAVRQVNTSGFFQPLGTVSSHEPCQENVFKRFF